MWINYLGICTTFGFLFLAVILFVKPSQIMTANRFLALILFLFGCMQFVMLIWHAKLYQYLMFLISSDFIFLTLIGTVFYHYVLSMLHFKINWNYKKLIHLVPVIFPITYYIYFQCRPFNEQLLYCLNGYKHYPVICSYMNTWAISLWIFYLVLSFRKVQQYQKMIKNNFSELKGINMSWIKNFILVFLAVLLSIGVALTIFSSEYLNEVIGLPTISFLYIFLFYKAITHPLILNNYYIILDDSSSTETKQKLKLSEDEVQTSFLRLVDYVEKTKPFLASRLTIKDLAKQLGVRDYILSKVINEKTGSNFYTFINTYRVEEAKKKLSNNQYKHFSIEAIGKESGFNSSSCFFEVFKKFCGKTPKEFCENLNN